MHTGDCTCSACTVDDDGIVTCPPVDFAGVLVTDDARDLASFARTGGRPALTRAQLDAHLAHTALGRSILARRAAPAEFAATATAPPSPAPPAWQTITQQLPPPPSEAEDAAFVARLRDHAAVAAGSLRRAIADLEGVARRAPFAGQLDWASSVRGCVERAERWRAMLEAIEGGDAYRPPDPAAIREAQGRAVVTLALSAGKSTPAALDRAARSRLAAARGEADAARARVESLLRAWSFHGSDVEELRRQLVPACRDLAGLEAEVAAVTATAEALTPALAAAIAKAVDAAGGPPQVIHDLADVTLVAAGSASNGEEQELTAIREKLESLGQADAGRAAQALRARRSELGAAISARRTAARDRAAAGAKATVEASLAGSLTHWRALLDAARAHPESFTGGLAGRLESAPLEAFTSAGFGGFATVTL